MTIKNWVDCRKYLPRLWADIYMFCIYIIEYKANEHIIQYRKIGDRIAIFNPNNVICNDENAFEEFGVHFFLPNYWTYSAMKFYLLSVQNDIV